MSDAGDKSVAEVAASESAEQMMVVAGQTAGAQLAAARLKAGLSLAQVAEQLKLSQRQIQAIENNDFAQLPKMVIVRGFVRAYAKLLRIDAQAILSSLPEEAVGANLDGDLRPTLSTPFSESRTSFLGRSEQTNRKYLLGAGGLAVAALLFIGFQQLERSAWYQSLFHSQAATGSEASAFSASLPEQSVSEAAPASSSATPDLQSVPLAAPATVETAPASQAVQPARTEPLTAAAPAAASSGAAVAPAAAQTQAPTQSATPAGAVAEANKLRLKFNSASWFQLKTADGKLITAHVGKAGSEEVFEVKEALQLRVGNASGVEVELRGQAQALVPAKDSNVANLNLK